MPAVQQLVPESSSTVEVVLVVFVAEWLWFSLDASKTSAAESCKVDHADKHSYHVTIMRLLLLDQAGLRCQYC